MDWPVGSLVQPASVYVEWRGVRNPAHVGERLAVRDEGRE
jgi:hypothetical protein